MHPFRSHIIFWSILLTASTAVGVEWFHQYVYWVNTGHLEYRIAFSMANHMAVAILAIALCGSILACLGKNRQELIRGVGMILFCSSVFIGLELLVRWSGAVQNYGELRDGRYISQYDDTPRNAYYTYASNDVIVMESGNEFRFERVSNDIGLLFRAALKKPEGMKRIIALGDSFTAGDGAHEDSTWVALMHQALVRTDEKYELVEVLNAGVQGSDPVYQYKLLVDKLLNYAPDLVILAINNTDIGEIGSRGGFERFVNDTMCVPRSGPWWEPVYASSHITRLVLRVVFSINYSLMTESDFAGSQRENAEQLWKTLENFRDLADKHAFRLLVCFMPIQGDLRDGSFSSFYGLEQRDSSSDESRFEKLNLFPPYIAAGISAESVDTYYWSFDGHHKAEGYRVFGEVVAKQIIEKRLLPPP